MPQQTLSNISVVIPCYNEESSLGACLDALAAQTLKPAEIIVVDNNCTDRTVEVAKRYAGVRIVAERQQGVIAARNRGLAVARGSVLVRIDADTRPAAGWLAEIAAAMQDKSVLAVSGTGYFYDFPLRALTCRLRNLFAVHLNRLLLGHHMVWGSNMAIRAEVWRYLAPQLCSQANIMEDLDIAMHLSDEFGAAAIAYCPAMRADISIRRGSGGLMQNLRYFAMWPRTLRRHRPRSAHLTWPIIGLMLGIGHPLVGTILRFYDGETGSWTLGRAAAYTRENP